MQPASLAGESRRARMKRSGATETPRTLTGSWGRGVAAQKDFGSLVSKNKEIIADFLNELLSVQPH